MAATVRILSIDGGGIRGIIPAIVLERIEDRCGAPIASLFHMIAGTSTGGIVAAGLAAPARRGRGQPLMSAAELIDLYRDRGPEIFHRDLWHGLRSFAGTLDEKYDAANLERVLKDELGDTRLSTAITDVLIPSYDIERRRPHFFKSWKAQGIDLDHDETAKQHDFRWRDAVRAATAAPTYFEPADIRQEGERFALIDGGVFANNPAMCALASARVVYPKATGYLVVSLGTGETQRRIPYGDAKDWGWPVGRGRS